MSKSEANPSASGSETQSPEGVSKKFCRVCHDFKTWAKMNWKVPEQSADKGTPGSAGESVGATVTSSSSTSNDSGGQEPVRKHECPVDKDELGRNTWSLLHTMAAYYPDEASTQEQQQMKSFLRAFGEFYPCDFCAKGFRQDLKEKPPEVSSRKEFSKWMCGVHNRVNKKLGKSEFDCSKVDERWKDGWPDGSCS